MGDFNNILRATNRIGGNLVAEGEFIDFVKMMENLNLHEKNSQGD